MWACLRPKKIIVFAPHPDDEVMDCGGTVAKRVHEGYEASVVFMTDGGNHFLKLYGISSDPTPEEYGVIRKAEARRAAKHLGIRSENLIFLDFEDGKLTESKRAAEKKVLSVLDDNVPVEIYFPRDKDPHPDHRATNRIITNSVRELPSHPAEYECSGMSKLGIASRLTDKILNSLRNDIFHIDISDFAHLKRLAMYEYVSQVTIFARGQKRPTFEGSFFRRFLASNKEFFFLRNRK